MRLFVARHGQTLWNLELRAQGHSDTPLDETGRIQAKRLAQALVGESIIKVVSSDLSRAADTAQEIASTIGAPLLLDARLREISLGQYEGLPFAEVQAMLRQSAADQGIDVWQVRPPGGESRYDVFERVLPIAQWLFEEEEDTLVMGHGGVCALLMAHLVKGTIATARSFRFSNAGITECNRHPEGSFVIRKYDDTSHLLEGRPLTGSVDGSAR